MGISGRIIWAVVLAAQVGTSLALGPETRSGEDRPQIRTEDLSDIWSRRWQTTAQSLRISIYVYNVGRVPARMLRSAEDTATKVFEEAGIKTTWLEPQTSVSEDQASSRDPWVPTNIALKICTRPMIKEVRVDEGVMGFVWRFETNSAVILYDQVQNLAGFKRTDIAPILGIAMAHEIGHLLLRSREHSSEGIMRRNWPSADLQSAAQAHLRFTAEQSQRMRDEVLRWSAQPVVR